MRIYLACALGMSTSILVNKMKDEIKNEGKDYEVKAINQNLIDDYIDDFDVLLLGPQIGHSLSKIKNKLNNSKPVMVIKPIDYGRGNAKKVIADAEELYNSFNEGKWGKLCQKWINFQKFSAI